MSDAEDLISDPLGTAKDTASSAARTVKKAASNPLDFAKFMVDPLNITGNIAKKGRSLFDTPQTPTAIQTKAPISFAGVTAAQRKARTKAGTQSSTIKTSPLGIIEPAKTTNKTLLGS